MCENVDKIGKRTEIDNAWCYAGSRRFGYYTRGRRSYQPPGKKIVKIRIIIESRNRM